MPSRRLATDFEGTTNPNTSGAVTVLDNQTGAMSGVERTGGGLSGQAGTPEASYQSRHDDFVAAVSGGEVYFRPLEGTPTPVGGAMPGLRVGMSWEDDDTDYFASLSLQLYGDMVPGPFTEATLTAEFDTGLGYIENETDLTAHDWFGWHRMTWRPDGSWEVAVHGGATLASGTLPAVPVDLVDDQGFKVLVRAENFVFVPGDPAYYGAGALVDNLYVYIEGDGPVVRLFPRDDGRGMSSAPRIWPPPKGRSRIIGGHQ